MIVKTIPDTTIALLGQSLQKLFGTRFSESVMNPLLRLLLNQKAIAPENIRQPICSDIAFWPGPEQSNVLTELPGQEAQGYKDLFTLYCNYRGYEDKQENLYPSGIKGASVDTLFPLSTRDYSPDGLIKHAEKLAKVASDGIILFYMHACDPFIEVSRLLAKDINPAIIILEVHNAVSFSEDSISPDFPMLNSGESIPGMQSQRLNLILPDLFLSRKTQTAPLLACWLAWQGIPCLGFKPWELFSTSLWEGIVDPMLQIRKREQAFHPESPFIIIQRNPGAISFFRKGTKEDILVMANISGSPVTIKANLFWQSVPTAIDLLTNEKIKNMNIILKSYGWQWLKIVKTEDE